MLLSKDTSSYTVDSCNVIVNNNQLGIVISDSEKNIRYFQYDPNEFKEKLKPSGDFNLGSRVVEMTRVISSLSNNISNVVSGLAFGTLDGNIGYLFPIKEEQYKRLYILQGVIRNALLSYCGLNPKLFRTAKDVYKHATINSKNIIDGCLLWKYNNICFSDQIDLAHAIGSSPETVIDTLRYIDCMIIS